MREIRYRSEIQVVLLVIGMIVWGYGQRSENTTLQFTGLGFFAAATALRFFKKKPPEPPESE